MLHIALHFLLPLVPAFCVPGRYRLTAYLTLIGTMAVDADHLLANPIYDPMRCSIGFHPLHQPLLFPLYLALCFIPKQWSSERAVVIIRCIGLGLLIHMGLDAIDCRINTGAWTS